MDWMADGLRQQGWAVWNTEYRGVDEAGGGYPGTFLDAGAATDQLREHAAEYNLDLSRVTGIGHSAGGHLILWLAARSKLPEGSPLRVSDPLQIQGFWSRVAWLIWRLRGPLRRRPALMRSTIS